MIVSLKDGRSIRVPLAYFPKLQHAKASQRKKIIISGGGVGLHWDEINEDLSVSGLLLSYWDKFSPK